MNAQSIYLQLLGCAIASTKYLVPGTKFALIYRWKASSASLPTSIKRGYTERSTRCTW